MKIYGKSMEIYENRAGRPQGGPKEAPRRPRGGPREAMVHQAAPPYEVYFVLGTKF